MTTLSGESDVSWTKTAVTALMFLAVCLMSFIVVCLCDACLCLLQSGSVQSENHLSPCEPELKFQLCGFIRLLLSTTVHDCPRTHAQSEVDGAEQEHVMFSYSMEMLLEGGGGLQSSLQRKQQTFTI